MAQGQKYEHRVIELTSNGLLDNLAISRCEESKMLGIL